MIAEMLKGGGIRIARDLTLVAIGLLGCGRPGPGGTMGAPLDNTSAGPVQISVVDSSTVVSNWHPMAEETTVYLVEIRSPMGVDTIANVLEPFPFAVGGDSVVGVLLVPTQGTEADRHLFVRTLSTRMQGSYRVPEDVFWVYHDLAISPDARYLAYVAGDPDMAPVVRTFPGLELVLRGPSAGGCDCDGDLNHARWITSDSVEIAVVSSADEVRGWLRMAARPSLRRFHVDTLKVEPSWH